MMVLTQALCHLAPVENLDAGTKGLALAFHGNGFANWGIG